MARIVLGVGGGIAAYKACELLRLFTESGHHVRVVPTDAALKFVGAATWSALSGQPVATDVWSDAHDVPHVQLGRAAELVVVAPATADLLARAAHGIADDLLTSTLLTASAPIIFAPAMHTEMWEHPATQANVALLRQRGALVIEPAEGRLTGADTGKGRLPEPEEIFAFAMRVFHCRDVADLTGRHVVVTAGGTREPIDPVRFIGNRSSGLQGYAFARTAVARGARVTLIAANVALPDPAGVSLIRVGTTEELRRAVLDASADADAVIMAAAPADFRPADVAPAKIRSGTVHSLELVPNPDIAAQLGAGKRDGQVLVAFAAETADVAEPVDVAGTAERSDTVAGVGAAGTVPVDGHIGAAAVASARAKLARKRADLIVLNQVGMDRTFGASTNAALVIDVDGSEVWLDERPKEDLADAVWDLVLPRLRKAYEAG